MDRMQNDLHGQTLLLGRQRQPLPRKTGMLVEAELRRPDPQNYRRAVQRRVRNLRVRPVLQVARFLKLLQ